MIVSTGGTSQRRVRGRVTLGVTLEEMTEPVTVIASGMNLKLMKRAPGKSPRSLKRGYPQRPASPALGAAP